MPSRGKDARAGAEFREAILKLLLDSAFNQVAVRDICAEVEILCYVLPALTGMRAMRSIQTRLTHPECGYSSDKAGAILSRFWPAILPNDNSPCIGDRATWFSFHHTGSSQGQ